MHVSKLPAAIEDVWPIVDDKGIIVELVRTWDDDAFVCLDEDGQPVDDIAHTHHLVAKEDFTVSDVPGEWNIVDVRRVSSGMTQLEALTAGHGAVDDSRRIEILTQLNAGAGIVIDEIDTTPPFTHIVQLGGEFYLAQMRSAAGMARLAGDDSVLGDLAETPPPVAAPAAPAAPSGAAGAQPQAAAPASAAPKTAPQPDAPASSQSQAAAPASAAPKTAPATPTPTAPQAEPTTTTSTAAQPAPASVTAEVTDPVASAADQAPSASDEIARQVSEAAAKEAAAGERPRRKRGRAARRPSLAAVAKADGMPEVEPSGAVSLDAVATPDGAGEVAEGGATLAAVATPDAPTGDSAGVSGLASVARNDDQPARSNAADLLKAVASPLDASADAARLEASESRAVSSDGLRSALDPDEDRLDGTAVKRGGGRGALLVDELRPGRESDPLRAASLAQADEFVSSAADGTLEISDDVLTLEQVRKASRFAWDELMNLYLPHVGFVAARVGRTSGKGGKADVTYLPRPEVAMRPIGWHHLADCDCEFCT